MKVSHALLAVSSLLLAQATLASDCSWDLEPAPEPTYFQRLESMFARGTSACDVRFEGWRTMRCYGWQNQNTPRSGMLAFPGGGSEAFQQVSSISPLFSDSPNYYDHADDALSIWIDNFLGARWPRYAETQCWDRSRVAIPDWVDVAYHLRRSGDYLVAKTIDEGSYGRPGEVMSLCYAFAPVGVVEAPAPTPVPDLALDWEETGARYERGHVPTTEALRGWRAGRCFLEEDHAKRLASLLATEDTGVFGDHGPLGTLVLKMNHLIDGRAALGEDYFDVRDAHRHDVTSRLLSSHASATNALRIVPELDAFAADEVGLLCEEYELRVRTFEGDYFGKMMVTGAAGVEREIGRCYWYGD